MKMDFIEAKIPWPKIVIDYTSTKFELSTKDIHSIDQMEMHK